MWVAFSGGKDSVCLYKVVKMFEEKYNLKDIAEYHYNWTSIDPPELYHFVKEKYPDVLIDMPERTMWQIIESQLMPPMPQARYCCAELKETKGHDRVLLTGVRWAESVSRKKNRSVVETSKNKTGIRIKLNDNDIDRNLVESCIKNNQNIINPIIDWNNKEVWEFIKAYNVSYCKLYDKGFKRLGCIGCPMNKQDQRKVFLRYPRYFKAYLASFKRQKEKHDDKQKLKDEDEIMRVFLRWGNCKGDNGIDGYYRYKEKLLKLADKVVTHIDL